MNRHDTDLGGANRGFRTTVWGDILTFVASTRGIGGTVIDGVCRDVGRSLELRYPIFSRGWSMRTGKDRVQLDALNVVVSIGGARVDPGDLLLGDADGVVVVPKDKELEIIEQAVSIDQAEERIREAVTSGMRLDEARKKLDPDAEVGDELLAKLPADKFGRIAAQAAKQNIIQRVRDAERDIIYNEFKGRKGQLFSGNVQRFEKKNIIVNLGRTDAILPEKEQIPRERYRQGDRIRAFILDVELTSRGPQIVLSRTHPGLLKRLFEIEQDLADRLGLARRRPTCRRSL